MFLEIPFPHLVYLDFLEMDFLLYCVYPFIQKSTVSGEMVLLLLACHNLPHQFDTLSEQIGDNRLYSRPPLIGPSRQRSHGICARIRCALTVGP